MASSGAARLDLRGVVSRDDDFEIAVNLIEKVRMVERLGEELYGRPGRPRREDLKGLLLGLMLNALRPAHTSEISSVTMTVNGFTPEQRRRAGLIDWDEDRSYDRIERMFLAVSALSESPGVVGKDIWRLDCIVNELMQALVQASIPSRYRTSTSVAIDGTSIDTWARHRFRDDEVVLDGDQGPSDEEAELRAKGGSKRSRPRPLGIGPDGRRIYTADPDARVSHRSASAKRSAGFVTGYELHLSVGARDVEVLDPVNNARLGPELPQLVRNFALTEAGAPRAAVGRWLIDRGTEAWPITDVIADRGMTQNPREWQLHLRAQGIDAHFDLMKHQRGVKPSTRGIVLVDGHPFTRAPFPGLEPGAAPLAMPPRNSPADVRAEYQAAFARRAAARFSRHGTPDSDGATRWRGPFSAGRLRSRVYESSMRRPASTPLVELPPDWDHSFDGTVTLHLTELPLVQPTVFGTEAHFTAYVSRRQAVESVNASLKEGKANLGDSAHTKVFGRVKRTLLAGFEIAAMNIRRVRAFELRQSTAAAAAARDAGLPKHRSKRRKGTSSDFLAQAAERSAAAGGLDYRGPP